MASIARRARSTSAAEKALPRRTPPRRASSRPRSSPASWSCLVDRRAYAAAVLIIGILLFGMLIGAGAQLILGREGGRIDWTTALIAGLVGSFVGGLLISLIAGDGLDLRPSGIIGSLVGAIIVTAGLRWWSSRAA